MACPEFWGGCSYVQLILSYRWPGSMEYNGELGKNNHCGGRIWEGIKTFCLIQDDITSKLCALGWRRHTMHLMFTIKYL